MWDRRTGGFLAEFSNGHEGRIFGVAMDCTKVSGLDDRPLYALIRHGILAKSQLVSCGEDEVSNEDV